MCVFYFLSSVSSALSPGQSISPHISSKANEEILDAEVCTHHFLSKL